MDSKRKSRAKANFMIKIGLLLLFAAAYIVIRIYFPIAKEEAVYQVNKLTQTNSPRPEIIPVNTNFGLVIPKILANAKVIANVNPFDSKEYQLALSRGVAHAKGSAMPGQPGNVFLFSHSSADFLQATQYNSVFYLLDKLVPGDEVAVYYQGKKYVYKLDQKLIVGAEEISYLLREASVPTLTLMTCWPPGTSLKRLLTIFNLAL